MSKPHEATLKMIDERIANVTTEHMDAQGQVAIAKGSLERAQNYLNSLDIELSELHKTKALLMHNQLVPDMDWNGPHA